MRLLCMLVLAGLASGATAPAALEEPRNGIRAIVNETIITEGQVVDFTSRAIDSLFRIYRDPVVLKQKIDGVRDEGLEQMVENQLILDDFKTGGAKVPEAMVEDEIKEKIRQRFHDRATLVKQLHAEGMKIDTLRQQIRDDIILRFMNQKNVGSAFLISPQKIERYYASNVQQYQLGTQVKLRMIVLKCSADTPVQEVKKMALEVSGKINEGVSFSQMAALYSEGSEQKEGGNLPWMEQTNVTKGFADIAVVLKPGQQSGVLGFARGTDDAYWIYQYNKAGQLTLARKYSDKVGTDKTMLEERKFDAPVNEADLPLAPQEFRLMLVEDKRPARTEPLAEVREKIEKELQAKEHERLRKKWIERLRAKAFVRYY